MFKTLTKREVYMAPGASYFVIGFRRICSDSRVTTENIDDWNKGNEDWF